MGIVSRDFTCGLSRVCSRCWGRGICESFFAIMFWDCLITSNRSFAVHLICKGMHDAVSSVPLLYKDLTVNSVDEALCFEHFDDAVEMIIACCSPTKMT